jgi:ferredoxin
MQMYNLFMTFSSRSKKAKSSRRDFLITGMALAGGMVATSVLKPFNGILFATEKPTSGGPWYGIGIDIEKCIGCGNCASSCKLENNVPQQPFYFRNWAEQYTIKTDGTVKVESPNGGIGGFTQSVPDDEIYKSFFVPKMCNHCSKSPCTQVCPVGAAFETPDGVNLVDKTGLVAGAFILASLERVFNVKVLRPTYHLALLIALAFFLWLLPPWKKAKEEELRESPEQIPVPEITS